MKNSLIKRISWLVNTDNNLCRYYPWKVYHIPQDVKKTVRNVTKKIINLPRIDKGADKTKNEIDIIEDIGNLWGLKRKMKTIKGQILAHIIALFEISQSYHRVKL